MKRYRTKQTSLECYNFILMGVTIVEIFYFKYFHYSSTLISMKNSMHSELYVHVIFFKYNTFASDVEKECPEMILYSKFNHWDRKSHKMRRIFAWSSHSASGLSHEIGFKMKYRKRMRAGVWIVQFGINLTW